MPILGGLAKSSNRGRHGKGTVAAARTFDVVFLRNVMIYFNAATQRNVVARVLSTMKPGGHLLVGHSESPVDVSENVELLAPAVYRKTP